MISQNAFSSLWVPSLVCQIGLIIATTAVAKDTGLNSQLEATLSYRQGAQVDLAKFDQLVKNSCVVEQRAAFTLGEQQVLKNIQMSQLQYTRILVLRDDTCFKSLKLTARDMNLDVILDLRDIQANLPGAQQEDSYGPNSSDSGSALATSLPGVSMGQALTVASQKLASPLSSPTPAVIGPDPFSKFQWAFDNQGQVQKVDLESRRLYCKPGVKDQDLGLKGVPMASFKKIRVALVDTGVDINHPDLKNIIARNEPECKAYAQFKSCLDDAKDISLKKTLCYKKWLDPKNPEVDQDKNGYPMDCNGWNLVSGTNSKNNPLFEYTNVAGDPFITDENGHGTHTAGIMGAEINNGIGVRGVTANIEIIPIKVPASPTEPVRIAQLIDPTEKSIQAAIQKMKPRPVTRQYYADLIARAFIYAINAKAQVVSLSIGWDQGSDSLFLRDIVRQMQDRGMIIVAAAGNTSTRALMRPCAYPGVICVGSFDNDGAISHFSSFGSGVDVLAPGLNILSTRPMNMRSIRFRSTKGYDYLTGTSMSTPFVSGMVAEMLSRGMTSDEVYSRLVLGAVDPKPPVKMEICVPEQSEYTSTPLENYLDPKKYSLSGNVNLKRSLEVQPQPLLLPVEKERVLIPWDRHANILNLSFHLKNHWQELKLSDVKIDMQVLKPSLNAIRPRLASWTIPDQSEKWLPGQSRQVDVKLEIQEGDPFLSRIAGDIDIELVISTGQRSRRVVLETEVIVPLTGNEKDSDITVLGFDNTVPTGPGISWAAISDNVDGFEGRDYFISQTDVKKEKDKPDQVTWKLWLVNQNIERGSLGVSTPLEIHAPELKSRNIYLDQYTFRFDDNKDGKPEYLLGFYEDRTNLETKNPLDRLSPVHFYLIDSSWKVTDSFEYDSLRAPIPKKVNFVKINGKRRPIWVGPGYDQEKKWTLADLYSNPEQLEAPLFRMYYLDDTWQLKSISKPKNFSDYKIVDVLTPSRELAQQGGIQVMLAKNRGNELIGSYLLDFAVADFVDGEIKNLSPLDLFKDTVKYRNLVETSVDQILSLDYELDLTKGTYWFSPSVTYNQSLSLLEPKYSSLAGKSNLVNNSLSNSKPNDIYQFSGYDLKPLRDKVDSALLVRSVYTGKNRRGAYVFTTSEIQYHDLITGQAVGRSLERYDFLDARVFQDSIVPVVIGDLQQKQKLPGLMYMEGVEISASSKVIVPAYVDGKIVELSAPARLKFKSGQGCRALDSIVPGGMNSASFMDYFCSDKDQGQRMMRVKLDY